MRFGVFGAYAGLLLQDAGQRLMHRRGHAVGIAADIDRRAVADPAIDIRGLLAQPVLHVDLLGLIARKRHIHAREHAVLQPALPFGLIQEVLGKAAVAKEQPALAARAGLLTLLHEGAERRDAGARPDHDERLVGIAGQAEVLVLADIDADLLARRAAVGEEGAGHPGARAAPRRCARHGDGQMHLIGRGRLAGSNRVKPGLELAQHSGEGRGVEARRGPARDHVRNLMLLEEGLQRRFVARARQISQRLRAGCLGIGFQEAGRQHGQFQIIPQRLGHWLVRTVHLHRRIRREAERLDDLIDQRHIIAGEHAEAVARPEADAGAVQRQLDVLCLLVRVAAIEPDALKHLRIERILARVGRGARVGGRETERGQAGRRGSRGFSRLRGRVRREHLAQPRDPFLRRVLIINIAIHALGKPLSAQRFKAPVEYLCRLAEMHIAGVAKPKHREFDAVELRRFAAREKLEETRRAFGRISLTVRGGDHDDMRFALQVALLVIGHVDGARFQARRVEALGGLLRHARCVPCLGGVEHHDLRPGGGRVRDRPLRRHRDALPAKTREKTAQPQRLLGRERRQQRVERLRLLLVEQPGERGGLGHVGVMAHSSLAFFW